MQKKTTAIPDDQSAGTIDKLAQRIVMVTIDLAQDESNLGLLDDFTSALHWYSLGTEASRTMAVSFYALNEYVDIAYAKSHGENVNEQYLHELREELLKGQI